MGEIVCQNFFFLTACRFDSAITQLNVTALAVYKYDDFVVVCYTAVFSVVTQRSSPLTAAENRTTFLSLCVCGLTNKTVMYKKLDNT